MYTASFELRSMIVFDPYRRRGIGRAIVADALERYGTLLVDEVPKQAKAFFKKMAEENDNLIVDI